MVSHVPRIINYLKHQPKSLISAIAKSLRLSPSKINSTLYSLLSEGKVERTSSSPALWSLCPAPVASSLSSSAPLPIFSSRDTISYSKLHYIATKYKYHLSFDKMNFIQDGRSYWQVTASLSEPRIDLKIEKTGAPFLSLQEAQSNASKEILQELHSQPSFPKSPMPSIESPPYSMSNKSELSLNSLLLPGPGESQENGMASLGSFYNKPRGNYVAYIPNSIGSVNSFYNEFKNVWQLASSFINLLSDCICPNVRFARIVYGVGEDGIIQGIPLGVGGVPKEKQMEFLKEKCSSILGELRTRIQPNSRTNALQIEIQEVKPAFLSEDSLLFVLIEVIVTIPSFPTLCAVDNQYYIHDNYTSSACKMSIHQLQKRFTTPSFRL